MIDPIIEFMAASMKQYDKNNKEKTWNDLAQVAYNAILIYLLSEREKINE